VGDISEYGAQKLAFVLFVHSVAASSRHCRFANGGGMCLHKVAHQKLTL